MAALREMLGSVERPLSLGGLARVLNERDGRARSASSIQRWEEGAEPDIASIRLMAALAGVPYADFALGTAGDEASAPPASDQPPVPLARTRPAGGTEPPPGVTIGATKKPDAGKRRAGNGGGKAG